MTSTNRVARLALSLFSALLLGAPAMGCTNHIVGGGNGDGGGGGAGGGDGGAGGQGGEPVCEHYAGDGCKPGDTTPCTGSPADMFGLSMSCQISPNEVCTTRWNYNDCNTPLVLSFDSAPVEFVAGHDRSFDLNGARSQVTDWPTARTPWLALDRDGNGAIDDGSELFGSMTVLSSGRRAPNGFVALRELDADGDGRITPSDPGFSRLVVWSDRDGDRRSSAVEIAPASTFELLSIDLDYVIDPRCDLRGNCEVERASFRYRDAAGIERTGAVVDIHLAAQR